MPPVLWALMFGNFVIGTGVMVVPGTLNDISASLNVSVPVAGQLISVAALLMCLGAPLLVAVVSGLDRRRLLALTMLWYGALHLLSATMPTFGSLMAVRVLTVISPAIFTPQAAACIGFLVPPHQRSKAISLVFLGWSVASVLGMPLGSWIGGTMGWRYAFSAVGLLAFFSAAWLWRAMPDGVKPPAFSLVTWRETLQSKPLMLCVAVTVLYSAGQFVLYSYFAPYYKANFNVTPTQLSLMFAWFGAFGFVGNLWVSRNIERLGASRTVFLAVASMALSLALWPLGSSLMLTALVLVPWALGCFSANSAQQARLSGIAPTLTSGSIALNTSAMYAGQGAGAASGGWLIAHGQMSMLHWAGLAGLLLALWVSWLASRAYARLRHPA
ncbi:MFS transporter [Rhodoferax sp. UBA5149]|uniref:MFS transporter n=1 Tax=Rhodoferax sp. UBA5149 TaxID=1947379 RepID=UPI0025F3ED46|nr:MFS transporter [Rhodoferax sp. UBA5149]